MSKGRIVWSDQHGDQRKTTAAHHDVEVNESDLTLHLRRLTSGKGRTIVEITELPNNKAWCKKLVKECKKSLGVGGAYKNNMIEVHGEKMEQVMNFLDKKKIRYKKVGG